jgi:hypothetical protein
MLGKLIDDLDRPEIAERLVATLDEPLLTRLVAAAVSTGLSPEAALVEIVRGFVDEASDDQWVQLIGILNRADDPGSAAISAILDASLPRGDAGARSHEGRREA